MKRIFACVLAVVMCFCSCVFLTSCGNDEVTGIFYPVTSVISSIDPQIAALKTERLIVLNCFEGLVRVNGDGEITEAAAENYTVSPDGLTYTFKLRENVKWHTTQAALRNLEEKLPEDFAPLVTAADFVFALRRAVSPETSSKYAHLLFSIENARKINGGMADVQSLGVRAVDEYTLEIKLSMPDEEFLYSLAEPVAMPCNEEFFNAAGGRYGLLIKYLLSNGPYYLSVLNDESWRMNISDSYSGTNTAAVPYVWLYYEKTSAGVASGISLGDYTAAVLDEYEKTLLNESSEALLTATENVTMSFVFNHNSSVFKNEKMRRAFCLATDTSRIAELFNAQPSDSYIPATCEQIGTSVPVQADSKAALSLLREGLEELGVDSASVSIYVSEGCYEQLNEYLQIWQSTLGVNFFVTLTSVSPAELESAVVNGRCDAAFYPLTGGSSGTRGFLMSFMPGSESSPLNLSTGAFELTMLRSSLMNKADCKTLEGVAADILTDECSILPVMNQNTYIAVNSGVTGIYSPYGNEVVFFANASYGTEKG